MKLFNDVTSSQPLRSSIKCSRLARSPKPPRPTASLTVRCLQEERSKVKDFRVRRPAMPWARLSTEATRVELNSSHNSVTLWRLASPCPKLSIDESCSQL